MVGALEERVVGHKGGAYAKEGIFNIGSVGISVELILLKFYSTAMIAWVLLGSMIMWERVVETTIGMCIIETIIAFCLL